MLIRTVIAVTWLATTAQSFQLVPEVRRVMSSSMQTTHLAMGLFDGVKDAFSTPALERSVLDAERETPIDRWMGWSVVAERDVATPAAAAVGFVDAMDEANYVAVELSKPMGIVFEENDSKYGGIFVQSIKAESAAAKVGVLQEDDQLVAVNTVNVCGMAFDDALGAIVDASGETTKLVLFRGTAKQLYGPTGASKGWLEDFIKKGGVAAISVPEASVPEAEAEEGVVESIAE